MTVTSVPAKVAPSAPPTDSTNANAHADKYDASHDGFASILAGAHEQAHRARTEHHAAKTRDAATNTSHATKSAHAEKAHADKAHAEPAPHDTTAPQETAESTNPEPPAATDMPADPVALALLAALAGKLPQPTPPDASATPLPADTAALAETDTALTPAVPAAAVAPTEVAPEVAAAIAALPIPDAQATVAADEAAETAPDSDAPAPDAANATTTGAPAPKPAAPTGAAPNTSAPTATARDTAAATAAANAAATAPAPTTVLTEPAPKPDAVQDNAMIAAATAAVNRTPTPEVATAIGAPAAPAAPADPPPTAQLAAVIRPLQRGADGTYQVRVEMRPPELGRVDMRVEIRDGVIHASIHTEHAQTADLVRSALDDLRARLDADGMQSGQFTVDSQGANSSERDAYTAPSDRIDDTKLATTAEPTRVVAPVTASDSLLDVRI